MASDTPLRRSKRLASKTLPPMPASQLSTLLSLPPELRLIIYEFALITRRVEMDSTTKPPSLLSTSRQVRSETIPVWYGKNKFRFSVINCDGILVHKFINSVSPLARGLLIGKLVFRFRGDPSWTNLKEWCRLAHRNAA